MQTATRHGTKRTSPCFPRKREKQDGSPKMNGMGAGHGIVRRHVERRLRPYFDEEEELESVCTAVLDGRVVRLAKGTALDVVALRRGVLFVAGSEYPVEEGAEG
jgi:hypothetical protein